MKNHKNQPITMKSRPEWLQETPRRKWWFFVTNTQTDTQFIIIHISSLWPSSSPLSLTILCTSTPLFWSRKIKEAVNHKHRQHQPHQNHHSKHQHDHQHHQHPHHQCHQVRHTQHFQHQQHQHQQHHHTQHQHEHHHITITTTSAINISNIITLNINMNKVTTSTTPPASECPGDGGEKCSEERQGWVVYLLLVLLMSLVRADTDTPWVARGGTSRSVWEALVQRNENIFRARLFFLHYWDFADEYNWNSKSKIRL